MTLPRSYASLPSALLAGCLWISAADHDLRTDFDRDGYPADQDCDDRDANQSPGLPEVPCNGTDDDCNPVTKDGPAFSGPITFDTVQAALDLAEPGAEVTICAGTVTTPLIVRQTGVVVSGNVGGDPTVVNVSGTAGASAVTVLADGVTLRGLVITGGTGNDHEGVSLGGGVDASAATGDLVLDGVEIYGCSATSGGGVAIGPDHGLTLLRSRLHDLTAADTGGAVASAGGAVTLIDSTLEQNAATTGGGLYVDAPGAIVGQGASEILRNTAQDGGGVATSGAASGVGVRENTATRDGGGVWLFGGSLTDVIVYGNTAASGGGVAGYGAILRGQIVDNTATDLPGGGGIYAQQTSMQLTGVLIQDNHAAVGDGGGVLAVGPVNVAITDDTSGVGQQTLFDSNTAAGYGGGVAGDGAGVSMVGGTLQGNAADRGGAVALWGACQQVCDHVLTNVSVWNNQATDGGGWYVDSDATAVNLQVSNNLATGLGGGLYVASGSVNESGSTYDGNQADSGGGLAWAGTGTVTSVAVSHNVAAEDGGGMWVMAGAAVSVSGEFFTNDAQGATISGDGGTVELTYCTFAGNEAYDVYMCDQGCTMRVDAGPYAGTCDFALGGCDFVDGVCEEDINCP